MDRVTDLYYPDNDHVRYQYNSASFVESINGGPSGETIISSISYEPTGQQRKVVFEEAWATMYRGFYDPNLHGANWEDIHKRYLPWAVNAAHPRDFDYIID